MICPVCKATIFSCQKRIDVELPPAVRVKGWEDKTIAMHPWCAERELEHIGTEPIPDPDIREIERKIEKQLERLERR